MVQGHTTIHGLGDSSSQLHRDIPTIAMGPYIIQSPNFCLKQNISEIGLCFSLEVRVYSDGPNLQS
jgi:hypothetical protein